MSKKKETNVYAHVLGILPSAEDIRDEMGNLVARLLSGSKRFENRAELKRRLLTLKETVCGAVKNDGLIDDLGRAIEFFEENIGTAPCESKRKIKKARLLAIGWLFAVGAVVLDRRWSVIFDTVV